MHSWLYWYCILYSSSGIILWQICEQEAESDPVCVTLWLLSCASYRCSCFQLAVEAHLVIRKISWFGLNPKQADLHHPYPLPPTLCMSAQKQTLRPPAGWRDGPRNPHSSAHPVLGCVGSTKWMWWSSLRATSVILSHLPAKREGEMRSRGLKEGWAWLWERIPLPAGWSDWMRVITMAETFAKSSFKLTMWPVEGQAGKEIEVNNIVTY